MDTKVPLDPLNTVVSSHLKISISHASFLEKKVSKYIWKWLNIHSSTTDLHLGRSGFGNVKPTPVPEEGSQAYRKLVTKTHREIKEEHNLEGALQLQLQCHWVQWEGYIQNSNIKRWHLASEFRCFLCDKYVCIITHILGD